MTPHEKKQKIRLVGVGDLLFTVDPLNGIASKGLEGISEEIRTAFRKASIVCANLECTLKGARIIPTEPRVIATKDQIETLKEAGVDIVCLSNNHLFDAYLEGYEKLREALRELEISWFGAGRDWQEATQARHVEVSGIKIAFLGFCDPSTGQSVFASEDSPGVAPFDIKTAVEIVRETKATSHHVIVSIHWGEERFRFPSPKQVDEARALIEAGASAVLGHHPHVIQGVEIYKGRPIAYSLGNFLANKVYFSNGDYISWSRFERTGMILVIELDKETVTGVEQIPTLDTGEKIIIDHSPWGEKCIRRANAFLKKCVTQDAYRREAFRVKVVQPVLQNLRLRRLKRVRPYHLKKLVQLIRSVS